MASECVGILMKIDEYDSKTRTTNGVQSTEDMDRSINDLASKFASMSTVIDELRSAIVGDANHSNSEGNHHGNRRFRPNKDGFFDNHDCDNLPNKSRGMMILSGVWMRKEMWTIRFLLEDQGEELMIVRLCIGGMKVDMALESDIGVVSRKASFGYVDKNEANDQRAVVKYVGEILRLQARFNLRETEEKTVASHLSGFDSFKREFHTERVWHEIYASARIGQAIARECQAESAWNEKTFESPNFGGTLY
ncbi:hypothetical protein Tco_1376883 [Tanacetum coccineum]